MKISYLIIAKKNSRRLPRKNWRNFNGKPMFLWNVEKCLDRFEPTYVSSDYWYILELAKRIGAMPIERPETLSESPNITVYRHAQKIMRADIIKAVQANSPTIRPDLIEITQEILKLGCQELITCHPDYSDYGSIWAMTSERLENYKDPYNSKPEILLVDDSVDIHTYSDFQKALCQLK